MHVEVRAKDCFFPHCQVTMSVPVLLLAIFIWFGLVLSAYTGNRFVMFVVCTIDFADYNNNTILVVFVLAFCFLPTKLVKSKCG